MIILEGPDNCGKTYLGNKLSEYLDIPLEHSGGPSNKKTMRNRIHDYKFGGLYDRCSVISEIVYGSVLKKTGPDFSIQELEDFLNKNQPLIIYCRLDTVHLLKETHIKKPKESEDYFKKIKESFYQILSSYDTLMAQIEHIPWDYKNSSTDYANLLVKYCKRWLL